MNKIFLFIICFSIFTYTVNEDLIQLCNGIIPNSFFDCAEVKFENIYKCCYFNSNESESKKICRTIKMDKWENIQKSILLVIEEEFNNKTTTVDCDISTRSKSNYLLYTHFILFLYIIFILI